MRTKLFLLLIFSSLSLTSYSQKLTKSDLQGLWYRIDEEKANYDSLYNLKFEKIIYASPYRNSIKVIKEKPYASDSGRVPNSLLQEISVITGGFGARYGCEEPLDVFEVVNDSVRFYSNIFFSDLLYTSEERNCLEKLNGYKYFYKKEGEIHTTIYKINGDTLMLRRDNSEKWIHNETLYYYNDTLILRNSSHNTFDIYVRKKIDTSINYKITKIIIRRTSCLDGCPPFTVEIESKGEMNFTYKNAPRLFNKEPNEIENGNYSFKIPKENLNKIFHLLRYMNIASGKRRFCIGMTDADFRYLTFVLSTGEKITFEDYHFQGPPLIRVLDDMVFALMKKLAGKK